ncbi:MAG: hypothetical protein JJ926_03985 [Roseitalea sp.]|nr:hypothetical protein [Roseitalea sp.]MBO6611502.1 hypothetical protein [Roseitalea sp.]MBO6664795.1 hypothetical protein [Roseitalea sp.]MBO6670585.1 hypothetical protein [Roseitalea sp.]MBO6704857.1 hypothetical protein [Roseitalea sp.]
MTRRVSPKQRKASREQAIRWHAQNSQRAAEARRLRKQQRKGERPITDGDQRLIDEHIEKHGVTVCPPMTYSGNVEPL